MDYDIFSKSKVLNFMGNIMEVVGYTQYNQIANVVDAYCDDDREIELVKISAILYVFLSKKLPILIRDIQNSEKENNKCIETLKELICDCENEDCSLGSFIEK